MTNFTDIRDFLRAHCARYPELALQDVFKALYQSCLLYTSDAADD